MNKQLSQELGEGHQHGDCGEPKERHLTLIVSNKMTRLIGKYS